MKALIVVFVVLAMFLAVPYARGDFTNICLTGNFLQLPVSATGQFLTTSGGKYNPAGTGGDGGTDFWIWGTPVYHYSVGVNGTAYVDGAWAPTVLDTSSGGIKSAVITGNIIPGLLYTRNISFGTNAKAIKIVDVFQNTGSVAFSNLVTLDSVDPDPDIPFSSSSYVTANDVVSVIRTNDLVVATGPVSQLSLGFGSESPFCIPSAIGFDVSDPYAFSVLFDPNGAVEDIDINISFKYGNLAPAETTSVVWYMLFDSSYAELISAYGKVAARFVLLHSFTGTNDGLDPEAGLALGNDGKLYGTTRAGGANNGGTVFKVSPDGTGFTTYACFLGSNGFAPVDTLVLNTNDGNFYGTTGNGGAGDKGMIFRTIPTGGSSNLFSFSGSDGANPAARLVLGGDGNWYGTTQQGGSDNLGTVFKLSTDGTDLGTDLDTLATFTGDNGANPGPLTPGDDGNLYGTTQSGGANGLGTIFKITTSGVLTTLASFNGTNGANPYGGIIPGTDGNFYGTTCGGGAGYNGLAFSGNGTVFKTTANGALTTLALFNGANGAHPKAILLRGSDGNFYGLTQQGGDYDLGTVFQMTPDGGLTNLVVFNGTNGASPVYGPLLQGPARKLYGLTSSGGAGNNGVMFSLAIPMTPVMQSVGTAGGTFAFAWNAVSGLDYQVQYSTNLAPAHWLNLGGITTATNGVMPVSELIANAQRFYRVILLR